MKNATSPAEALKSLTDYVALLISTTAITKDEKALRRIANRWDACQTTLTEWTSDFLVTPAHAFEWAELSMKKAAAREILDRILIRSRSGSSDIKTVLSHSLSELVQDMVQNRYRSNSTSQSHNATMSARAEAASEMIETLKDLISSLE